MAIMILSYEPSISLHIQMQRMWLAEPDTDFHMTSSTDTDILTWLALKVAIITAGGLLRIHSSHSSNLKARLHE